MGSSQKVACVTGASGMVGQRIVERLSMEGYIVRALYRQKLPVLNHVDAFYGGLEDEETLKKFIDGADYMYHCAAELRDESKMWQVNVEGTQRLLNTVENSSIKPFFILVVRESLELRRLKL